MLVKGELYCTSEQYPVEPCGIDVECTYNFLFDLADHSNYESQFS